MVIYDFCSLFHSWLIAEFQILIRPTLCQSDFVPFFKTGSYPGARSNQSPFFHECLFCQWRRTFSYGHLIRHRSMGTIVSSCSVWDCVSRFLDGRQGFSSFVSWFWSVWFDIAISYQLLPTFHFVFLIARGILAAHWFPPISTLHDIHRIPPKFGVSRHTLVQNLAQTNFAYYYRKAQSCHSNNLRMIFLFGNVLVQWCT